MHTAAFDGDRDAAPACGHPWSLALEGGECAAAHVHRVGGEAGHRLRLPPHLGTYACLVAMGTGVPYSLRCEQGTPQGPNARDTGVQLCDLRWGWIVAAEAPLDLFVFRFTLTGLARACDAPTAAGGWGEAIPGQVRTDRILTELALAIAESCGLSQSSSAHLMRAFLLELGYGYPGLRIERTASHEQLAPWQLLRATNFIRERIAGKATVGEIAGLCGLSTSYFSRLFKNTTGMTTHQWIVEQRLEHARHLLVSTAMPLVDVAYACGFADQTHFTRVFSRRMNASPMVWRRHYLCRQQGTGGQWPTIREAG